MNDTYMKITEQKEPLPNFLCVGTVKAGTSTFADMIKQHPEVFTSEIKELMYFNQKNYQYENHQKYSAHFKGSETYKIRVEFSAGYLYPAEVPDRVLELLGSETKILILLRNPVDRAFSDYVMNCNNGTERDSFEGAFHTEVEYTDASGGMKRAYPYFDMGMYSKQVQRYLDAFKYVKIVLFEDFIRNTDEEMIGIYGFLGIENHRIPLLHSNEQQQLKSMTLGRLKGSVVKLLSKYNFLRRNTLLKKINRSLNQLNSDPTKPKQKIDPAFAKVLQDYYYDDICELEKLIGRDLTAWKTKY